jgi:hypothetical protein
LGFFTYEQNYLKFMKRHDRYTPPICPRKTLALLVLLATLASQAWLPVPATAAPAPEQVLEDLQCLADAWILTGAVRARIILKSLGDGLYRVEAAAEAQGLAKVLSGQRRDNFSTEMRYQNGRLLPLVYREESRRWGKYSLKEYRFDYEEGRLELWQHHEGKGLLRKWETALTKEPIYDPFSAFYNFRLGAWGQPKAGQTLRVQGIPYPRPEEMVIQIGQVEPEGRKVMVSLINRVFNDETVEVFIFFDDKWAPSHGWTRVFGFGKIEAKILPESRPLAGSLPEMVLKSSRFRVPGSKLRALQNGHAG